MSARMFQDVQTAWMCLYNRRCTGRSRQAPLRDVRRRNSRMPKPWVSASPGIAGGARLFVGIGLRPAEGVDQLHLLDG